MDLPVDLSRSIDWNIAGTTPVPAPPETVDAIAGLIASAQAGETGAFRQLVDLHQEPILRFCGHWLRNAEDAQEAAQDTFLRAWQALDRFENRGHFSHWLYRIALNVCRDRHKSKASRQRRATATLGGGESPLACHRPAPDEALARSGDLEKLQRGIHLLPERLRAVLILCAQEGLSHEECAEVLHCSSRAVEGRLYRARKELVAWWNRVE